MRSKTPDLVMVAQDDPLHLPVLHVRLTVFKPKHSLQTGAPSEVAILIICMLPYNSMYAVEGSNPLIPYPCFYSSLSFLVYLYVRYL